LTGVTFSSVLNGPFTKFSFDVAYAVKLGDARDKIPSPASAVAALVIPDRAKTFAGSNTHPSASHPHTSVLAFAGLHGFFLRAGIAGAAVVLGVPNKDTLRR